MSAVPRYWISLSVLLGAFFWMGNTAWARSPEEDALNVSPYGAVQPYADLLSRPYEYHGAKRKQEEPKHVEEVRIGLFGPSMGRRVRSGGWSMRRGAELALAEATAGGGYRGIPFVLAFRADDQIWGSAREMVRLVYEDSVWAVMGAIGGQSTHIAEQIITKAHVSLISPASTDPSLTQINIPWMFRCMPDDERITRMLAKRLFQERGYDRVAAIAAIAYDSRVAVAEFEKMARRWGTPLTLNLSYTPGDTDFSLQLHRIEQADTQALVIFGQPEEAARLIRGIRKRGNTQEILGGPELASPGFLDLAGAFAEGITVVAPCDLWRDDLELHAFRQQFWEQYGEPPDMIAAYAYDGMKMLIQAIRVAGLNRARIRDAMAEAGGIRGVTGEIRFDGSGSNTSPPVLAVVHDGDFVPLSGTPLSMP